MSFSGYDTALEMRRLIETVAAGVVNKLRPRPRYGAVQSIDAENSKCTVLFVGDTEAVEVNTGSLIPSHIGQRVRVEGLGVDKCVTALYGNEGVTVHAASTGPFVKLARIFTGTRKEVTLDASTPDQLKIQFASNGAASGSWLFNSDGTAYYGTETEANQIQVGRPEQAGLILCTSTDRPTHVAGRQILETDTGRSGISDGAYWTLTRDDAYCELYQATSQSIPSSAWTTLSLTDANVDGVAAWHSGNTIVAPWTGTYELAGSIAFSSHFGDVQEVAGELRLNDTAVHSGKASQVTPSGSWLDLFMAIPTRIIDLSAGQSVSLAVWQYCGGSANSTIVNYSERSKIYLRYLYTKIT